MSRAGGCSERGGLSIPHPCPGSSPGRRLPWRSQQPAHYTRRVHIMCRKARSPTPAGQGLRIQGDMW